MAPLLWVGRWRAWRTCLPLRLRASDGRHCCTRLVGLTPGEVLELLVLWVVGAAMWLLCVCVRVSLPTDWLIRRALIGRLLQAQLGGSTRSGVTHC